MLSAKAAVRRLIGHNINSNLLKLSSDGHISSKVATIRFARQGQLLIAKRNLHTLRRWQPATLSRVCNVEQCNRKYSVKSSGDNAAWNGANDFDDEDSDGDGDGGDFRKESQRLPVIFSVPEVWPRLPVIVNNGGTLFPNYMKVFEVRLFIPFHWTLRIIFCFIYRRSLINN